MQINLEVIFSAYDTNHNFLHILRLAKENRQVEIFKYNRTKYMVVDLDNSPFMELTDNEKIDNITARIMSQFMPTFEELTKQQHRLQ